MNSKPTSIKLLFLAAPLFFACRGQVKEAPGKSAPAGALAWHTGEDDYLAIDTAESVVTWKGANAFGSHTGTVSIRRGELQVKNGQLAGGAVEVDMTTLEEDKYGRGSGLVQHLKDPDFFDVKKFPAATISLTEVRSLSGAEKEITGNLTIKGITRPVSFPAEVAMANGRLEASGRLVIDRTQWGIHYGSGKIFSLVADKVISDSIQLGVIIVAKK